MLPLGGMFTAVFVLKKWGIPSFIEELTSGMENSNLSSSLIRGLLTIGAGVVAFIIFNEIYSKIVGVALIG